MVFPSSPDVFNECDSDPTHNELTCPRCVRARARRVERIAAAKARGLGFKPNASDRGVRICGCRGCGESGCGTNVWMGAGPSELCGNWHTLDERGLCSTCAPHHSKGAL